MYPPYVDPATGQVIGEEGEDSSLLTDGMTPLDVLSSVFGSTLPPSELEEALVTNGYDFERAMAWILERQSPQTMQGSPNRPGALNNKFIQIGRDAGPGRGRGFAPVAPGRGAAPPPRYMNNNNGRPPPNQNRVCRYFVAGECLRADCRFRYVSHKRAQVTCD
jgi:hypothetical protein